MSLPANRPPAYGQQVRGGTTRPVLPPRNCWRPIDICTPARLMYTYKTSRCIRVHIFSGRLSALRPLGIIVHVPHIPRCPYNFYFTSLSLHTLTLFRPLFLAATSYSSHRSIFVVFRRSLASFRLVTKQIG